MWRETDSEVWRGVWRLSLSIMALRFVYGDNSLSFWLVVFGLMIADIEHSLRFLAVYMSFKILHLFIHYLFRVGTMCTITQMQKSEANLQESVLSLHHVTSNSGLKTWRQAPSTSYAISPTSFQISNFTNFLKYNLKLLERLRDHPKRVELPSDPLTCIPSV